MTDLHRIATLVAEIDKLATPTTQDEIESRLRRISIARFEAAKQIDQLLAHVEALHVKVHEVRNADSALLGQAEVENTILRRGLLDALDIFAAELPCEEACQRMADTLRAALAAIEVSTPADPGTA